MSERLSEDGTGFVIEEASVSISLPDGVVTGPETDPDLIYSSGPHEAISF